MNTFHPDDIVYTFEHLGKTYQIVRMAGFPWRKAFGFKPKGWPYVLVSTSGYAVNGVSESDLDWYRQNR